MAKQMFDNPSGNNFIDDFLNEIGPKVGNPQTAISLKNEATVANLIDILIAKEIFSQAEFDESLKKKFEQFIKLIDNSPKRSPIQIGEDTK